jgi:hypothetical protein
VKDQDEQLLGAIARRNWVVLSGLVLLSLLWRSAPVTLGVLSGGLVAIGGYRWLQHSLQRVLAEPSRYSARSFKISYFVRLGSLAAVFCCSSPSPESTRWGWPSDSRWWSSTSSGPP